MATGTTEDSTFAFNAFRVLKPWVEGDEDGIDDDDGDITWNDWASDASEWGTAGCDNASDAGSDNSSDGSGYDRWSTASGSGTKPAAATTWFTFTVANAVAQGWYSGDYNENGVILIGDGSGTNETSYQGTYSVEIATEGYRPRFSFTYSASAPAEYRIMPTIITE